MGQVLSFTVETLDDVRHGPHRLADFARLEPAIRAAKLALSDHRVTLAVVKDRDGALRFCADRRKEWPP